MSIKEFVARERKAAEEAYVKGNVDALDETLAPDVISHTPSFPDVKGLKAYKQVIEDLRKAFTNMRWAWDESVVEGNTIANRYTIHMKHTGVSPTIPVPATGKEVVLKGCVFLHVKNDKIVEIFEYTDYLGLFQQLGIVPPMGQE